MDTHLQKFQSSNRWYSLEYPRMWEMQIVENIPCFFNPIHGSGSLQLFSANLSQIKTLDTKQLDKFNFLKGANLIQKMNLFLNTRQVIVKEQDLKIYVNDNNTQFVAHEFKQEDHFFTACMFQKKHIFLLGIYNCLGVPPIEESDIIGAILKSIEIEVNE